MENHGTHHRDRELGLRVSIRRDDHVQVKACTAQKSASQASAQVESILTVLTEGDIRTREEARDVPAHSSRHRARERDSLRRLLDALVAERGRVDRAVVRRYGLGEAEAEVPDANSRDEKEHESAMSCGGTRRGGDDERRLGERQPEVLDDRPVPLSYDGGLVQDD